MPPSDPRIGEEIGDGRYRIVARVGQGNMGQVFRARDANLNTDVVVKFPVAADPSQHGPAFLDRFDREVRSLVRLSHPHVVKIIDVGHREGQPFVVMEYLAGGSLKDRAEAWGEGRARPLPPGSLCGWLMEVAKALDFVHGQDYLHRDVKPANILFDRHGNAYLGDFGIIKAIAAEGDSDLTAPGFVLGTPNYVAPEVVMGRQGDGRVDQYALAMTVHELLCGRNPMAGPTPSATVVNQTSKVAPPLAGLVAGAPPRLSRAVERALSKDPAGRFDSCVAFAREALADVSEPAPGDPRDSGPATLPAAAGESGGRTILGDDDGPPVDPSAATAAAPRPTPGPATRAGTGRRRLAAFAVAAAALLGSVVALGWLWRGRATEVVAATPPGSAAGPIMVNIAYGTEKKNWLEAALKDYEATHGPGLVKINLIGMGSVEGAQAVLDGEAPVPIHVWSPASSAYRGVFEREWRVRRGGRPILRAENLALTPMVFVMWKARRDAFVARNGSLNFSNLAAAMHEPGGWSALASRPEWGLFKFGHAHPEKSNSGLLALTLMAYEFAGTRRDLKAGDVASAAFQGWLRRFESDVTRHGGSLTHSTGTMMQEMVLRGPSQYDCVLMYENLAIDYLPAARERWGELYVDYPDPNLWNEHPFYILDAPWPGHAERAAGAFLDFLLSAPVQRRALHHGFRPGNPAVPVRFPGSPFVENAASGVKIEVPDMAEPPAAEVVTTLLGSFRRLER